MALIGNILWVWDHTWMSCVLEQPEWLKSCARSTNSVHQFSLSPLYKVSEIGFNISVTPTDHKHVENALSVFFATFWQLSFKFSQIPSQNYNISGLL